MKLLKYILSIIFTAGGTICFLSILYGQFNHPELTQTEILLMYWHLYLIGMVLFYIGVIKLKFLSGWNKHSKTD